VLLRSFKNPKIQVCGFLGSSRRYCAVNTILAHRPPPCNDGPTRPGRLDRVCRIGTFSSESRRYQTPGAKRLDQPNAGGTMTRWNRAAGHHSRARLSARQVGRAVGEEAGRAFTPDSGCGPATAASDRQWPLPSYSTQLQGIRRTGT
jgi:hypothetical protein